MATFIKIAPYDQNMSGITSKGYMINRKGRTVYIQWGAIKSKSRKFYWAGPNLPQTKTTTFKTLTETMFYLEDKLRRNKRQDYHKLPAGRITFPAVVH